MMEDNKIWYEKYQPQHLEEFIFAHEDDSALFRGFIKDQTIPNLLLSGSAGVGKSSMINILMKALTIGKFDVKIMSGSVVGVEVVRNNLDSFCKILSMNNDTPFKVVVIEEADEMSIQAQKAFRMVIDNNKDNARFIFTSNYPEKIIPALHSRVQEVHITQLDYNSITERVCYILECEDIIVTDLDTIHGHIDVHTPDLRKIINSLQQFSVGGTLKPITDDVGGSEGFDDWDRLWSGDKIPYINDLLAVISQADLRNPVPYFIAMYDYIDEDTEGLVDDAIPILADYMNRISTMACQELNLHACVWDMYEK